jgi:nucleoside-diphosphate-sugar epimerase
VDRVLITGAAGRIGRTLRQGLQGRFRALRLLDLAPLGPAEPGEELVTADVRDLAAVTAAAAGVDGVVHLAGIPQEDTFDRILQANVVGTFNVFEAAQREGCARVVFASSLHVTGFYDASERIALVAPDVGFTVVYGASASQRGWWDPGPVDRLGYRPVDDAEEWAAKVDADADPTESGEGLQGGSYAR